MRRTLTLLALVLATSPVLAQYRSSDGMPGPDYWQNKPSYTINADFKPSEDKITASENIVYANNSPQRLDSIVFNLYRNQVSKDSYSIGKVCQGKKPLNYRIDRTKMIVYLSKPLKHGKTTDLNVDWTFNFVGNGDLRAGKYKNGFFAGYWYPQIAVFDEDGWDNVYHSGMEEFYFENADYDVTITAHDGYTVLASSETLETKDLSEDTKQTHHVAKGFYDFSFAASKTQKVYDYAIKSGKKDVKLYVMSNNGYNAYDIKKAADVVINRMGGIGLEFPFSQVVVYDRDGYGGGMEFAGMVNIGISGSSIEEKQFIARHELCHEYAPFLAGFNQARQGYMDEGFAMLLPYIAMQKERITEKPKYYSLCYSEMFEQTGDLTESADYPLEVLTKESYTYNSKYTYNSVSYNKSFEALYMLRETLGREKGDSLFHNFFLAWAGKHPKAEDLLKAAEHAYGSDLQWFIKPWYYSPNKPELTIESCKQQGDKLCVTVRNVNGIPVPVKLIACNKGDGDECGFKIDNGQYYYYTPIVWKDGSQTFDILIDKLEYPITLILGADEIPHATWKNIFTIESADKLGALKN